MHIYVSYIIYICESCMRARSNLCMHAQVNACMKLGLQVEKRKVASKQLSERESDFYKRFISYLI